MNDIFISREYGITLFHALYPIKYMILSKKLISSVPNKRRIPLISALLMLIIAGESGGTVARILAGQRPTLFDNDFRIHCAVTVWLALIYAFPQALTNFLFKWLETAPYHFLLTLPHEFRRGMALCGAAHSFRKLSNGTSLILPIVLTSFTQALGQILYPMVRFHFLLTKEEQIAEVKEGKQPPSVLETLPIRFTLPFICSALYFIVVFELGYQHVVLTESLKISVKVIIAMIFTALPLYQHFTTNNTNNKTSVKTVSNEKKNN